MQRHAKTLPSRVWACDFGCHGLTGYRSSTHLLGTTRHELRYAEFVSIISYGHTFTVTLVQQLPVTESPAFSQEERSVYADALSQAITGEWVGMQNYAALAAVCDAPDLAARCVSHAASERRHALYLRACAQQLNLVLIENPAANYWGRIRSAFMTYAAEGDLVACFAMQEVLLEGVAVALYSLMARVAPGELGRAFASLESDEANHAEHGQSFLAHARSESPNAFDIHLEQVYTHVMPLLMRMLAKRDQDGHCGVCASGCMKQGLASIGLDVTTLRGMVLREVLNRLDLIGVPGEKSLQWTLNLPT